MIRFRSPSTKKNQLRANEDFTHSQENMVQAVRSHLINCAKATTPFAIAEWLSKLKVPQFIMSGGADGKGSSSQDNLINLLLLNANGLTKFNKPVVGTGTTTK